MLKYTVKFEDYNGEEQTKDLYFNISMRELRDMSWDIKETLENMSTAIQKNQTREVLRVLDELIDKAYGIKDADGMRFRKSDEITKEFMESPAYDEFVYGDEGVLTDTDRLVDFFRGVLPRRAFESLDKNDLKEKLIEQGINAEEADEMIDTLKN